MRRLLAGPLLMLPDSEGRDAACRRAEALLRASLTDDQHAAYLEQGYVDVPSKAYAGRVYRVDAWRPVSVLEHGRFVGAVCIRPNEHLPAPDVILARKLMIEGAEDEFLRVGNWLSPAWRPAGFAPTLLLLAVLLSPWLIQLREFGAAGVAAAILLVSLPGLALAWRVSRRRLRDVGAAHADAASRPAD